MTGAGGTMAMLRRLVDRFGDLALAGMLSVGGIAQAVSESASFSGNRSPILVLLATVPLVWRRRWPLAVLLAVFLGAAISREAPFFEITAAAIAAYSVGAHEMRRLLGVAALLAICGFVLAVFGGRLPPLPDFAGPFVVTLPLWLVGNAMRLGRARADSLAERARQLEREQQLTTKAAQAEERARISRELHDVVAHSVSVMVVQAGAARQVIEKNPERAAAALQAVEDTGREAMQELRGILGVLGEGDPEPGPQPDLRQVGTLVEAVKSAGLPVELEVRGAVHPLPAVVELTAYRVIQEALTNAVKHSGLASTHVAIEYRPDELKLEVLCDGSVRPQANGSTGRGVAGMKERVALVGGRVEVGPGVDKGYNVRVWLPLKPIP
jgi:signal transduction histidine kinase